MRFRSIILIFGFFLYPFTYLQSQTNQDKLEIYKLVIKDFVDSVSFKNSIPFGLIDSTRPAIFWGGFPDEVNIHYFGFSESDMIKREHFRWTFIDSTRNIERMPAEICKDTNLVIIDRQKFQQAFWVPGESKKFILTSKGFTRFYRQFGCKCFCEFSRPYVIDNKTTLIYFNFHCDMNIGMDNVYLMGKNNDQWEILHKLRQWQL
jgi:hypothetical protein